MTAETSQSALTDLEKILVKLREKYEQTYAIARITSNCESFELDAIELAGIEMPLVVVKCIETTRDNVIRDLTEAYRKYKFVPIKTTITLIAVYAN